MNRYQILIEYVGTNFRGWQIQKKGPTIQGLIQEKLSKLLKEKIVLHGQGRTCLLYTSPSPRDLSTSRMPSSA